MRGREAARRARAKKADARCAPTAGGSKKKGGKPKDKDGGKRTRKAKNSSKQKPKGSGKGPKGSKSAKHPKKAAKQQGANKTTAKPRPAGAASSRARVTACRLFRVTNLTRSGPGRLALNKTAAKAKTRKGRQQQGGT
mmetsp:Transcript_21877/g.57068  ORF Transcript_21877/g.57068 Transcript_21877/m.57068 type:complete len:138 (+) Transcript_21877:2457-2870(+)